MADECVNMLNLYTEDEKVFALLGEIFGEDNPAYRLSQETGQYSGSKWIEIQEALPGKEGDTFELCLYFLSAWAPPWRVLPPFGPSSTEPLISSTPIG
tara:strand:+ start:70 stop:363 length:294 start_codon:yes stop_codon:yes gene_type:complete